MSSPASGNSDAAATSRSWSTKSLMRPEPAGGGFEAWGTRDVDRADVAEPALVQRRRTRRRAQASSACVPSSTSRPASKTNTRSACSAVDRRCAIVITVRPADRRRSASVMRCSVAGSTALVASSRISKPGLADLRPRQRDQLALADGERLAAFADLGVEALGQRATQSPSPSSSNAVSTSRSLAAGRPVPHVLPHGRVEQEAVLRHHPDRGAPRRRRPPRAGPRRRPRCGPPAGSASRARSFANVVLPPPVSPTIATWRPPGPSTEMPCSTGPPRGRRSRTSLAPGPRARPAAARRPCDGLDDLDRQVEHRQDLAPARDRGLRLGVDLGQVDEHVQEDVAPGTGTR